MSDADLEGHFAGQLQAAGWTRLGGAVGAGAMSTWRVPGAAGQWWGHLLVVQTPVPDRHRLQIHVERVQAGRPVRWADAPIEELEAGTASAPPSPRCR